MIDKWRSHKPRVHPGGIETSRPNSEFDPSRGKERVCAPFWIVSQSVELPPTDVWRLLFGVGGLGGWNDRIGREAHFASVIGETSNERGRLLLGHSGCCESRHGAYTSGSCGRDVCEEHQSTLDGHTPQNTKMKEEKKKV
jgi:hypothetical protein